MVDEEPPTLDYRPSDSPRPWHRRMALWVAIGVALTAVAVVPFGMLSSSVRRPSVTTPRSFCASNEHQIGLAILLYQQDNAGHYPPAPADLVADEHIGAQVFVCPASNDTAITLSSTQPTTREVAAMFAVPGHLSYLYFGHADWTDKSVPADAIVLGRAAVEPRRRRVQRPVRRRPRGVDHQAPRRPPDRRRVGEHAAGVGGVGAVTRVIHKARR